MNTNIQADDMIGVLLKQLRMPHAREQAADLLTTAKAQRWDPHLAVTELLTVEAEGRTRSVTAARRKRAGLPTGKTFDLWEPTASSVPAATQSFLRTLEWVKRHENLVVCGPSGTGKSFLIEALASAAIDEGMSVAWLTLETLGTLISRHRVDNSISKAITRIITADLICIDDIGLLPVSDDAAEGLYRIVDAAYEKRSIALSSNLHPAGFDQLMPKTLATATVDRLLHHAHVTQTSGEPIRLTQAQTGKGVHPMS